MQTLNICFGIFNADTRDLLKPAWRGYSACLLIMLKRYCFLAIISVAMLALMTSCSLAPQREVNLSNALPKLNSPEQSDSKPSKEDRKVALAKELKAVTLKLNSANEVAQEKYLEARGRIAQERVAGWSTDINASSKADLKNAENERDLAARQLQNQELAVKQYRQILSKPEYQQTLQDMGLSPDLVLNEPIENISIKVNAASRTQTN